MSDTVRVPEAAVGRPKVLVPNVVPKPVICTWFKALLADSRTCRFLRVSPKRQVRFMAALRLKEGRPGMVSTPAFPYWPVGGVSKAASLK